MSGPCTETIYAALRADQLAQPPGVESAYGTIVESLTRLIAVHSREIAHGEEVLAAQFPTHPDAELYVSQPGMGIITAARVLGEIR